MRVLFLNKYTAGGPSSRYRVLQFLPYLEQRGIKFTVHALHDDHYLASRYSGAGSSPLYLARRTLSRLSVLTTASRYDLVFIQKEMLPHVIDLPEWFLWRSGVRYVVDLDDAIHLMYTDIVMKRKIPRVLSHASLVLAGNRYLAEYASKYAEHVLFFPTVVDTDKFHPGHGAQDRPVTVGWMGTPETVKYLDAVMPALEKAATNTRLSLLVVGAKAPAARGVTTLSKAWTQSGEADDLRAMDIGVMPLAHDEWSKGKCALKLIQYMSAGVASVTSPEGSAVEFVRDGDNAWFATKPEQWSERIRLLAESPEQRVQMGQRARATVEADYSLRVWGPRFASMLGWAVSGARSLNVPWEKKP